MEEEKQQQLQLQLPQRPKRSNDITDIGRSIALATNHFKIKYLGKSLIAYQYAIEIEPAIEKDARFLQSKIIKNINNQVQEQFGNFSHRSWILYSFNKHDEPVILTSDYLNTKYTIRFKLTDKQDLKNLGTINTKSNPIIQIMNSLIKQVFSNSDYLEIGRNSKFYKKQNRISNQVSDQQNNYDMYVWPGFKATTCLSKNDALLQIDFSSRVFRKETALQFINDRCQNDYSEIIGKSVIASYGNYRIYRVDDVLDNVGGIKYQFSINNEQFTLEQYYLKKYQTKIQYKNQPLLVNIQENKKTGEKKTIYLIPELMQMTGLTDEQSQNGRLMKAVAEFTKLSPDQRMEQISECADLLCSNISNNQIQIQNEVPIIKSFQLNAPNLQLAKNSISAQSGDFQLRDLIIKPCNLNNWALVYYSRGQQDDNEADNFVNNLQKCSQAYGINVGQPGFVVVQSTKAQDWIQTIQEDIKDNGQPQIIVTLISSKQKSTLYPKLKEFLIRQTGIPHQNVVIQSLQKNVMAVCSKILLQINTKLGLPLWITPRPKELSERTMLIGIDVYHKLIQKKKSCFGFVATLDPLFSVFFSKVTLQPPGKEFSNSVGQLVEEALNQFFLYNGKKFFPDTIILFRDGCGESQIEIALYEEVQSIYQAFKNINKDYNPKFAEIIVNKKINQRFFQCEPGRGGGRGGKGQYNQQGKYFNPQSGTIVADFVTGNKFDYFVCAQNVRQGTCTPTHYTVIQDTTGLNEEVFWQLTYFQCFNYYNWSGAVKVPAPVQYAHKLCYLAGETFQDNNNNKLNQSLFYL